jgi:uncharacterized membrane protein
MPSNAAFCPSCGRRMIIAATTATHRFAKQNALAALAYVTFIPAIIFLSIRSFKQNRLVRFHSLQSIFFSIAVILAGIVLRLLFGLFAFIPKLGYLFGSLAVLIVALGVATLWVVMVVKALQGEMFKALVIGHFAEKE